VRRYASHALHVILTEGGALSRADGAAERLHRIQVIDAILKTLESDARLTHFTLIGGTRRLEDYLTLRPEHFPLIEMAIRQRRLILNPVLLMPTATFSPEMLIRTLLLGGQSAAAFGRFHPALILSALPSELPQIAAGFGQSTLLMLTPSADTATMSPVFPLLSQQQGDDGTVLIVARALSLNALIGAREQWTAGATSRHLAADLAWEEGVLDSLNATIPTKPDERFLSHAPAFLRAIQGDTQSEALAPLAIPNQPHTFTEGERLLREVIEPAAVLAHYGALPMTFPRPTALIRSLWTEVIHAHVGDRSPRLDIAAYAAVLASGRESPLNDAVRVEGEKFRIMAVKPAEGGAGWVVRGVNEGVEPAYVTLTPFRPFRRVAVLRMDETPTGGVMGVEKDGAIRFKAAPKRMLTFGFGDS